MGDRGDDSGDNYTSVLFRSGVLVQASLAIVWALVVELIVTFLRKKPALLYCGLQRGINCINFIGNDPPYAPYWIILIGIFCAVILGKHVYGGLGQIHLIRQWWDM